MAGRTRKATANQSGAPSVPPVSPAPAAPTEQVAAPEPAPIEQEAAPAEQIAAPEQGAEPAPIEQEAAPEAAALGDQDESASVDIVADAQAAVRRALDALDALATHGAFVAGTPVEQALVTTAMHGIGLVRDALAASEQALRDAADALTYRNIERRSFAVLKDVLLDNVPFAASSDALVPLTQEQHAQLLASSSVAGEWEDGATA